MGRVGGLVRVPQRDTQPRHPLPAATSPPDRAAGSLYSGRRRTEPAPANGRPDGAGRLQGPVGPFFCREAFGSVRSANLRASAFAAYPPSLRSVRYSTVTSTPAALPSGE
ncbi:hypothetical protein GCM10025883_44350 [Mobilicoccus caccae]|uniref:Uncharacterized protein n=1 Tax=Mobilicoccus caccae TaxID=1859295 RepID=A0ABQ6IYK8_9MICO|nr:hypothetical protein GCM10025883_44350 [Mobilicoccus caccae]